MRIATIDVGTNTAELLVADVIDGSVRTLYEDERFVRLGEGVDATGQIGSAALKRLNDALRDLKEAAEQWEADPVIVGATSASRDAENREAVIDFVQRETGLTYEVLSGEEEATWTFAAACAAFDGLSGRCAVLDIGGGSTEIIVGRSDVRGPGAVDYRRSLNIGTVRLTERFFEAQPPSFQAIKRAESFVQQTLDEADVPLRPNVPAIGNSGTNIALALVNQGPDATWDALDDAARVLSTETVHRWRERLLRSTFDEVRALHPTAMHGRADVFPMGMLLLDVIMQEHGIERCRVSPYQLRHGLLLRHVMRQKQ